jgi:catechol 2,3-dioxygenase-like lactoylglutathione lyase family enzyme
VDRPALTGILETCLYVEDVGRSKSFYNKVFGFEPMLEQERICPLAVAPGQVLILFQRGGTLDPVPVDGSFIPPHDGNGPQHFAFSVPEHALDHWKSYLTNQGIAIESEVHWRKGGRSIYFRDPDGLLVELATPGLWTNYQS